MRYNRKSLVVALLAGVAVLAQSFVQQHEDEKPVNLKVLPKDISGDELHNLMRTYSMSLGVRCSFCHATSAAAGGERPGMDFAADSKQEKITARNMIVMTKAINERYIAQMNSSGHKLEEITCVTCHMGHKTPITTTDSLKK